MIETGFLHIKLLYCIKNCNWKKIALKYNFQRTSKSHKVFKITLAN